jgi:3-hydroxyacyl-CoA dehydrogenase
MSIETVFVAGAGLMGHGIAQVHAAIGKRVVLYEPDAPISIGPSRRDGWRRLTEARRSTGSRPLTIRASPPPQIS